MNVHILGSGDAFGSGGRDQARILPESIDAIAVTHFHGDHFAGIPWMLLHALHAASNPRGLRFVGPAGVHARVLDTLDLLFGGARGNVELAIDHDGLATFDEYVPRTPLALADLTLVPFEVRHSASVACYGLRLESRGKVFACSGDTQWTPSLVDLAAGADLFLVECQAWDLAPPGHLSYATLREHLSDLHARRILLTHMGESMLARAHEIDDPRVACADDGWRLAL
jgi:ribonuclease BN (tRNA processing enzyme)